MTIVLARSRWKVKMRQWSPNPPSWHSWGAFLPTSWIIPSRIWQQNMAWGFGEASPYICDSDLSLFIPLLHSSPSFPSAFSALFSHQCPFPDPSPLSSKVSPTLPSNFNSWIYLMLNSVFFIKTVSALYISKFNICKYIYLSNVPCLCLSISASVLHPIFLFHPVLSFPLPTFFPIRPHLSFSCQPRRFMGFKTMMMTLVSWR